MAELPPSLVCGVSQSFFTRKLEGALAWKRIPHRLRRFAGACPEARRAGLRFADAALEDFVDEWLYRPAVGSRWHFEENARVGGFELARDATHELPASCDQAFALVRAHVTASCAPFGVTEGNVQAWIDEVLRPWQRALGAHLAQRSQGRRGARGARRAARAARPSRPAVADPRRARGLRAARVRERRAGILRFYADFLADAGEIPDPGPPPQPRWNRPFAPPWQAER